jgi:hypothetical protein
MNKATLPLLAALAAAGLFVGSLKLPVWHLKMESPQYQGNEALKVRVYPGSMQGDLREITVLNKYIGVRIPEKLPELRWLPLALLAGAALGLGALALPRARRTWVLFGTAALVSVVMLTSAGMAQAQMHRIGHDRNPHAALTGVPDFTPPILGRVKVANFEITTSLGSGAWLIAAGIVLQIGAGLLIRRSERVHCEPTRARPSQVPVHSEAVA